MLLPETGICSEMVAVEATSFGLDLTINSVSCSTWSNDFYTAVRNHLEEKEDRRAEQCSPAPLVRPWFKVFN